MKNRKLACFRKIYSRAIKINYQENKFKCYINFLQPYLNLSFNFDNLSFLENNNEKLVSANDMSLSNLTLKTLHNYYSLRNLYLNNIYLENINVISQIDKVYNIKS